MHLPIMPHPADTPAFTALLYLLDITLTVEPDQKTSIENPRSYAPWLVQEEQLVWCLWQAIDQSAVPTTDGKSYVPAYTLIAKIVQRTTTAITRKLEDLVRGPPKLTTLPQSSLPISQQDVELLKAWNEPYDRDALAWRYGQPIDRAVWAVSEQPTLRVVEVSWADGLLPGTPRNSGTMWRDQVNAANAAWVDLAAQLCTDQGGLILYTGEDPYGSRLTAIRSALKRHGRRTAPRQRVRRATPDVLAELERACPDVILLYEPERWDPQTVQALKSRTIIVVVPYFPSPDGPRPTNAPGYFLGDERLPGGTSWLPRGFLDWKTQEDRLRAYGQGRIVERIFQHGIPNTSGTAARIDWPALRHLPASGQVLAGNELLLLRAAVWYQLSTGRRPKVSDPEILSPGWFNALRFWKSAAYLTAELHSSSLPTAEKIRRRILLDLHSHKVASDSDLSLEVSDQPPVVYIGR